MNEKTNATPTDRDDTDLLLVYLQRHEATCPACGYNLHQLREPRCPECGRKLALSVGVVEPFLRTWIALAIIAAADGSLGLLFAFLRVLHGPPGRQDGHLRQVIWPYILCTPVAVAVLLGRRRFVRWPRSRQRIIAIADGSLSLALFAYMVIGFA